MFKEHLFRSSFEIPVRIFKHPYIQIWLSYGLSMIFSVQNLVDLVFRHDLKKTKETNAWTIGWPLVVDDC